MAGSTDKAQGDEIVTRLAQFLVQKSTPEEIQSLVADQMIGKSLEAVLGSARTHQTIEDQWMGERTRAHEGERVGPPQAAEGGRAAQMVREYSDTTGQRGITAVAEELGARLARLDSTVKAIAEESGVLKAVMVKLVEQNAEVTKALANLKPAAKAEEKEDKEDEKGKKREEEDEEEKAASLICDRADVLLKSAQDAIAAADIAKAKDDAADFRALADVKLRKAIKVVKSVPAGLEASLRGAKIMKAIAAVAKAEEMVADNQDIWPDDEKTVEKAAEPKAEGAATPGVTPDMIQKCLDGQAMLTGTMQQVMTALSRASTGTPPAGMPALVKGDVGEVFAARMQEINDLHAAGRLTDDEMNVAHDVLSVHRAVAKGKLNEDHLTAAMTTAPDNVRALFTAKAAA